MTDATLSHQRTSRKRVFGYGRASTRKQIITLPAQEECCRNWFELQKSMNPQFTWEWAGWFPDPATSSRKSFLERPAVMVLLERVRAGDTIVIAKFDRAFRGVLDRLRAMHSLKEREVHLEILDLPGVDPNIPIGTAMLTIVAAFKQLERDEASARTKAAMEWKKLHGLPIGYTPMGWTSKPVRGKDLPAKAAIYIPNKYERDICDRIAEMVDSGMTYRRVSEVLNREGVEHPRGKTHGKHRITPRRFDERCVRHLYSCAKKNYALPNGRTTSCTEAQYRRLMQRY